MKRLRCRSLKRLILWIFASSSIAAFLGSFVFIILSHWRIFSLSTSLGLEVGTYTSGVYIHNSDISTAQILRFRIHLAGEEEWQLDTYSESPSRFISFQRLYPHSNEFVLGIPWWFFILCSSCGVIIAIWQYLRVQKADRKPGPNQSRSLV